MAMTMMLMMVILKEMTALILTLSHRFPLKQGQISVELTTYPFMLCVLPAFSESASRLC